MSEIIFEAASETLLADPRIDAYEAFADWLTEQRAIALPQTEVIVRVEDGNCLPGSGYNVPEGKAVGCFCIDMPDGFPRFWMVALALGDQEQHAWEQEDRLVTLAHELLHLAEFYERFGQPPGVVIDERADGYLQISDEMARPEGDEIEEKARHLTRRYLGYG